MLDIMDFFFGPNRSSNKAKPSGARAVYQTVDGRLYARVGGVDEEEVEKTIEEQTADELEWLRHSVAVLRDAILAHKQAKHLNCDALDVVLWSHVDG